MQKKSILAVAFTTALAVIIAVLTLTEIDASAVVPSSDKHQHILAFAALAFPIAALQPRWLIAAVPLFAIFGGAIEILQPYVGRSRDLFDWIADLIGIGSGAALGLLCASLMGPKSRREMAQER